MPQLRHPVSTTAVIGTAVRDLRVTLGWTQRDLARRARVSQPRICRLERGPAPRLTFDTVERVLGAMGARLVVTVDAPYLADRRLQHDAGHARCVAYVVGRLRRAGWQTATEVEVGGGRSRGWIDILAHHPDPNVLLVIEVKTELHDLGAIERTLGWYEREAWAAARRLGWRPRVRVGALLVLDTASVDERIAANRKTFELGFPGRARDLAAIVAGDTLTPGGRIVALIDPRSRRADWIRSLRLDGRRTTPPYRDYAAFVSARSRGPRRSH